MSEIFSERSRLKFTENGEQILSWNWKHPLSGKELEIISGYNEKERFFGSGSYLMYPWVNRHTENKIRLGEEWISLSTIGTKDKNGYPSHGLAYSWKRKIVQKTEDSIGFELCPEPGLLDSSLGKVIVRETYSLRRVWDEEVITLKTSFLNRSPFPFRFCYGYHPYFRMKSDRFPCVLRSNLSKQIPLREDLIPEYPIRVRDTDRFTLDGIPALDSLFFGENGWVLLQVPDDSYQVRIRSNVSSENDIRLSYFQIYTDLDRNSIAIEPMSAPGNAFPNDFSLTTILPEEEKSGCFQILLSAL
ncbi:aldose 1-epimerase [Leptospira weilii serovar Ranarum str. ICFT]|uniref:Aldose 1-epimerase n=1 Tax=Leptospira weilii serovar Ranarum str. ICFT TaxID=1218598 RepID=N1WKJ1_9LEPT|nr:aldose 1-epimerase [Leptospira weilii]EMY77634.1 aldose 1-epimerase [Leptospira weilii serovar Ranarum str. ICFT]